MAIRGHEEVEGNFIQLLLLSSEECPQLRQWIESKRYLCSDIVNEIIGIMAYHILREIFIDIEIRQSLKYSLIADEATDVSNKEPLFVTIRWADDTLNIHEDLVDIIYVPNTTSETLASLIKD